MRAINLANALVSQGHGVVIWSTDFYHQEKRHRFNSYKQIDFSEKITIRLIPSIGYRRNIGLMRLLDHFLLARSLKKLLKKEDVDKPDVAFVGFPPIEIAAVMLRWLKQRGIPSMIDAKDQWPDIFLDSVPLVLKPIGKIVLSPYFYLAKRAMLDASAFCAMSEEFVQWMHVTAGRGPQKGDCFAPLTAPRQMLTLASLDGARMWWKSKSIQIKRRVQVSFVGSLSHAFDFGVLRKLAILCLERHIQCKFVVCGDGSASNEIAKLLDGLDNVILIGWIDSPKMSVLYECSIATFAPYINNDAFERSVPNKIIDSLSHEVPVITTLQGVTASLLQQTESGYAGLSIEEMFKFLVRLLTEYDYFLKISRCAAEVYKNQFSCEDVYNSLAKNLVDLVVNEPSAKKSALNNP